MAFEDQARDLCVGGVRPANVVDHRRCDAQLEASAGRLALGCIVDRDAFKQDLCVTEVSSTQPWLPQKRLVARRHATPYSDKCKAFKVRLPYRGG